MLKAGERPLPQILPRGSDLTGSFNVCRCGEPLAGDSQGRADDQARVLRRNAGDVNSSNMKGPRGLSGKLLGRRCRSVPRDAIFVPGADEEPWLKGKRGFLCSTLRNAILSVWGELAKLCRGGSPDIRPVARGVTPASHVNRATMSMTNAGRSPAAGVVPGAHAWSHG